MNENNFLSTPKFATFLQKVEQMEVEVNTTAKGETTIQQTPRNVIRREGLTALIADLKSLYEPFGFDVVETKEGIVIVAENEPGDWTFSWELKNTIKSLDFDPYIEANNFEEAQAMKAEKRARLEKEKTAKANALAEKRAKKLEELERKRSLTL